MTPTECAAHFMDSCPSLGWHFCEWDEVTGEYVETAAPSHKEEIYIRSTNDPVVIRLLAY